MACAGVGYWVSASGIVQAGGGGTGSSVSSASLASIVRSATLAPIELAGLTFRGGNGTHGSGREVSDGYVEHGQVDAVNMHGDPAEKEEALDAMNADLAAHKVRQAALREVDELDDGWNWFDTASTLPTYDEANTERLADDQPVFALSDGTILHWSGPSDEWIARGNVSDLDESS